MKLSTKVSLLCSARLKALQSVERLHNNDLTFPSEVWWLHAYVCMCGWRREKKKKDWQGKSNYFEGLSIIHEKTVFQRLPERGTRVKDLSSLPILHSSSICTTKIRPPCGKRKPAFSVLTDVNASVHIHAQLLRLNGDGTLSRHDHKC